MTGDVAGPRRLGAIGLICLAMLLFAFLDLIAKWLGRELPPLQVTYARYVFALVLSLAVLNPWTVERAWVTRRPWLQILRGLFLFGSTYFNFVALKSLQLAETAAIAFAGPFLIAALSGPVLGEWIGPRRWAAIVVGFCGVLIVIQPGFDRFHPAMIWSVGSVCCYAGYSITTRKLTGIDSASSMLIIASAVPTALLTPIMPFVWVAPASWTTWVLMAVLGLLGAGGHFMVIRAFSAAPAPILAPFSYTQILWMITLGWAVFGDLPGLHTITGAAIVIASGLYLIYRETVTTGRFTPPPPAAS